jgi:hypothetical protein
VNRRAWLGLWVGALSGGCLAPTRPPKTRIAWVRLENERDDARAIGLTVVRNGETAFSERYRLGAGPEGATVRVDSPVEGPGRYSVYVDVGDRTAHLHPSEFADAGVANACVGVRYTLHERGTTGFTFESAREC